MSVSSLPAHYQKAMRCLIRFACWMTLFALITGILYQESGKKVPFESYGAGLHWETVYHLAMVHGHAFLIGVLIPIALVVMMYFTNQMGCEPVSEKVLCWCKKLYMIGAGLAVLLMVYKGYHVMLSVRFGETDFAVIESTYFGGLVALRHSVYAITHTAMSVGLGLLVWKLNASWPKETAE